MSSLDHLTKANSDIFDTGKTEQCPRGQAGQDVKCLMQILGKHNSISYRSVSTFSRWQLRIICAEVIFLEELAQIVDVAVIQQRAEKSPSLGGADDTSEALATSPECRAASLGI